ncbi:MAG: class I SAM-dependent methyltransferase [Synergistaceae bacterium]|nr:class I SAM-dependent methyltransferase [Synergistaceae bacterium]
MFDSYLEFDPAEAALRYKESEEFAEIRRILAQKKPAGVVLDIGAGNGILSFALAEQGYQVLALEPGNGAVTGRQAIMAIQNATGTKFEILDGWGEAIPLNDGSVDVVAARQVLHHAKDLKKMCAEVYRVLKPGGAKLKGHGACRFFSESPSRARGRPRQPGRRREDWKNRRAFHDTAENLNLHW